MGLFNNFPYSDLNSINLDYTLNKLNDLYERGQELYADLQEWKQDTDEEVTAWINETNAALEVWKNSTSSDLSAQVTSELNSAKSELAATVSAGLLVIEGTAYGTQNGEPVEEGSPYYQNNCQYYKEQASFYATESRAWANGQNASPLFANNNSKYFRERSEAWAVGQINGTDVPDSDDTYENNAKYYSDQIGEAAAQIATNTGDIANLKNSVKNDILDGYNLYQGQQMIQGKAVRYTNGNLYDNTGSNCTDYIDISKSQKIIYARETTTASSATVGMAFYDETKTYISGISNLTSAPSINGIMYVASIPAGAVYARFTWWNNNTVATYNIPLKFAVYDYDTYIRLNAGNIKGDDLALPLDYDIPIVTGMGIRADTGAEYSTIAYNCTEYISLDGISKIVYSRPTITGSSSTLGMAFYNANKTFISGSGIPNLTNAPKTGYIMHIADVPAGAVYARFTWWNDTYKAQYNITDNFSCYNYDDYVGSIQYNIESLKTSEKETEWYNSLGLHTKPDNNGVLNAIKRCRQFTEFEWTPAIDLPRAMMVTQSPPYGKPTDIYEGVFKAGVTYRGLPYSNTVSYPIDGVSIRTRYGKPNGYIGINIGFDTFATAIANANSMECQEARYTVNPRQVMPYAAVCSSMVCYALNVAFKETGNIPNITGMVDLGKVVNNGVRLDINSILKLGDIVNERNYHVSMITDIVRDGNNNIEFIEISEATVVGAANQSINGGQLGGVCRRIAFTVDDFFDRYADYNLYRYSNIDSVPYTKSPYVNVGDEIPMNPLIELPCMPYEGEGFTYTEGLIPYSNILISCHDYGYLRVFKNGTEIAGSPYTVASTDDYITVDYDAAGDYYAYLCNMANGEDTAVTAKCHWKVVAAT